MPRAWDRPSPLDKGDAEPEAIYTAVGKALSDWGGAEEALALLFSTIVAAGDISSPAIDAYSAIEGARNRANMVRAALEAVLRDEGSSRPTLVDLSPVISDFSGWSERRNDMAHGCVDRDADDFAAGWFLYPSFFTKKRPIFGVTRFRYTSKQIHVMADGFQKLNNSLSRAADVLQKR
jgi:hypothetical protein